MEPTRRGDRLPGVAWINATPGRLRDDHDDDGWRATRDSRRDGPFGRAVSVGHVHGGAFIMELTRGAQAHQGGVAPPSGGRQPEQVRRSSTTAHGIAEPPRSDRAAWEGCGRTVRRRNLLWSVPMRCGTVDTPILVYRCDARPPEEGIATARRRSRRRHVRERWRTRDQPAARAAIEDFLAQAS